MFKTRYPIPGLIFLVFSACVKELPCTEKIHHNDMVINSIIRDDKPITASISSVSGICNPKGTRYDSTFEVTLYENDVQVETFTFYDSCYHSGYLARPGQEYTISAVNPQGIRLKASTRMPSDHMEIKCESTIGNFFEESGDPVTQAFITVHDDKETRDYYFLALGTNELYNGFSLLTYGYYWNLNDPVLISEGILEYNPSFFVFSDDMISDGRITIGVNFTIGYRFNGHTYTPHDVACLFRKISEEYYFFLKSLIQHQYNQNIIDLTYFDPLEMLLRGEPSEIYTNVIGGKGIFGAYCEKTEMFKFNPDL